MSYPLILSGSPRVFVSSRSVPRVVASFIAWAACIFPLIVSAQNFTVAPSNLAFGSVPLGASASLVVTITNTSGVSQTPSFSGGAPFDSVNFSAFPNCAGKTLAPGGTCQFTYQFNPTTLGWKSTSTTIGINAENFAITMSGTGISAFSVVPSNLAFGSVPLGASASLVVTITNTSGVSQTPGFSGGGPLDSVNFGGLQNCAGKTLAPGGTCQFIYEFHPTTVGVKSTSTTIGINAEKFAITMSGTGIDFNVAPLDVAFGNVPVGGSSSMVVTVTNVLGVSQTPHFSGTGVLDTINFGEFQNCAGVTLAPGGTCQFTYVFHPTTLGVKSTSDAIRINGEDFSITMSGIGVSTAGAAAVEPVPLLPGGSLVVLIAAVALLGLLGLVRQRRTGRHN